MGRTLAAESPQITQVSIVPGASYLTTTAYSPDVVTVVIGVNNTVRWTNNDNVIHTATGTNSSKYNTGGIDPGTYGDYTFTAQGTFPYYCVFHPTTMVGKVIVRGGAAAVSTSSSSTMTSSSRSSTSTGGTTSSSSSSGSKTTSTTRTSGGASTTSFSTSTSSTIFGAGPSTTVGVGGAIPEFPNQLLAAVALTFLVVLSYVLVARRIKGHAGIWA